MASKDPPGGTRLTASPGAVLAGSLFVPGDKSISHRALILGALARGESLIEGLLEGDDVLATATAVRSLGAEVERVAPGRWRIVGQGRLTEPAAKIDCGNSGTGARLLMGAAAGFPVAVTFTGDVSLRSRPMERVLAPLADMGARWSGGEGGRLPLTLTGGGLTAIDYTPPQASAQVKSAILLAALEARGRTCVTEPRPTRDHTERMLPVFGAEIEVEATPAGRRVSLRGGQQLTGARIRTPGDPSSAAFLLVAALVTRRSEVTVEGVLLNPSRTGLIETLREMGGDIEINGAREEAGEQVGDVTARASALTGVVAPPERAPAMIDEYPALAVAAAFARGETVMRGIGELRVKESDRIAKMARGLAACGVDVAEEADGLIVRGSGAPPAGGTLVETGGDHRIAMAFLVLGLGARAAVSVDRGEMIATSFPGFAAKMASLGAAIEVG